MTTTLALAPMMIGLIAVGALIAIVAIMMISIYNRLVALGMGYKNSFAQIDVQLKRRYDLIPNLVETAKGYLAHERGTLEAVISARNQAAAGLKAAAGNPGDAATMAGLASADGALTGALSRLMVVAEAYPDLKANQNMMQLTEELTSTENKVSFARQAYNDAVMRFNVYRRSFPPVVFASMFGYRQDAGLLEFADKAAIQEAPKVKF